MWTAFVSTYKSKRSPKDDHCSTGKHRMMHCATHAYLALLVDRCAVNPLRLRTTSIINSARQKERLLKVREGHRI